MDPILRRSSFYYLTSAVTYLAVMGRYMLTRDWPVFEVIPLFMPVWLLSAMMASESDERYAFLRTLPVTDRGVVRTKFVLILLSSAFQWTLMVAAALARMDEGIAGPSTIVYLTLLCVFGLLLVSGFQIGIWRFGFPGMKPALIVTIVAGILLILVHLASLKAADDWPALSQSGFVGWLARAPWISSAAVFALALVARRSLMRLGARVAAASEAHLSWGRRGGRRTTADLLRHVGGTIMACTIPALFRHVLFVAALLGVTGQAAAQEYYFAIEVNGILCGYSKLVASPLAGAPDLTMLTHETVVRGTLLGAPVDSRITLTYHVDPVERAFSYHESVIEQGPARMSSAVRIEGGKARVSDGRGGPETLVDLPADVVLDNTLAHPHLAADFAGGGASTKTYRVFDGRDNAVRETTYTRAGAERLLLAGRQYDTVVLDSVDRATGVNARLWLDPTTGVAVQTRNPGARLSYLASAAVVDTVMRAARRPSLDPAIMAKANVAIPDIRGISYMRVRMAARPTGLWLTPAALNVPGQRFTGTVTDNLVDGVFEIEHARYDGSGAPAFPADVAGAESLQRFLGSDDFIQAADPVIAARAREITAGARDSWEAARRLSAWVAQHITGAIPGGVTARGTLDQGAGDCGGHSFLLAALCRSAGIPARVVWGCMYTPHGGGAFGQHAWNEVHMGPAGWIPLDSTIGEADYVDSGHVRIGVFGSVATSLNIRSIEVLDHRVTATPRPARSCACTSTAR